MRESDLFVQQWEQLIAAALASSIRVLLPLLYWILSAC